MLVNNIFKLEHERFAHLTHTGMSWEAIRDILCVEEHPLSKKSDDPVLDVLRLIRDPKNFFFTCKYIFNIELGPFQNLILYELWNSPFPMLIATRGGSKSTLLAIYAMLRALLCQGCKVALIGSVFRQSKVIFENCERIWNNAPVLRDLVSSAHKSGPSKDNDKWSLFIGDSVVSAYPLGSGAAIRGQRAQYLIVDEFASINVEVYENVVQGFASVEAHPIESMKKAAIYNLKKELGMVDENADQTNRTNYKGNQQILAGTAYYSFNHFYAYWKKRKAIIEYGHDPEKLRREFDISLSGGLNPKDYKIFRIPYDLLPEGFMSTKIIESAKATVSETNFNMEYCACYASDSDGFFKMSLLNHCTTTRPIATQDGEVQFRAVLAGDPHKKYIYGIDPAAKRDNCAIVILEVNANHARIVYSWTATDEKHKHLLKTKKVDEHNFYRYVARKIRNLMKVFPCSHIALDAQGGGFSVAEVLGDPNDLKEGEQPIFPVVKDHPLWDGIERETDDVAGLHLIEYVQMVRAEYATEANHGMKKDFETQKLLFPLFDSLELGLAAERDSMRGNDYETLEECVWDIEELKRELTLIQISQTPSGREHWDTPEQKLEGDKKGRMKKDRYSALMMANAAARRLRSYTSPVQQATMGRFSNQFAKPTTDKLYIGPEWFTSKVTQGYGMAIRR